MMHEKEKTKILFISNVPITDFVKSDLEILKKNFDVRVVDFISNVRRPKDTIEAMFNLIKGILWSDIAFSWFADIHAFWALRLSKLFKKKSIVIVGGFEVANVPEINYGLMRSKKSARKVKYVLKNADRVLTVDDSLKLEAINDARVDGENIITVPTGYDSNKWKFDGEKEDLVITACVGNSWNRARLKGLDTFVKSAKFLTNAKFLMVGIRGDALKKLQDIAPSNVEFIDPLSQDELMLYYQKAKVYCQLSMREGLPNALCEAMLCECAPVGTERGGIPTAIGDTGFYVPYGDPKATAEVIKEAVRSEKGKEARERIKKMFPIEKREKELKEVINNILLKNTKRVDYDEQK